MHVKTGWLRAALFMAVVLIGSCGGNNNNTNNNTTPADWTTLQTGQKGPLRGIAWSGTRFAAVGDNGAIVTSPDGNTWTSETSGSTHALYGVIWAGSRFVAVGDGYDDGSYYGYTILASP